MALKSNGTVVAWGSNRWHQCDVPAGLTDVKAIAASQENNVALKKGGTTIARGRFRE